MERLYQNHTDIVIEIILKYVRYPKSYVKELASLGYTSDEIYRFIFSNYLYDNELNKRPLSKLIRDIATELNLLDCIEEEICNLNWRN